ncbi:MAG: ATP-dependent zinc metalloprotease FtsH, partial [Candidatus Omnitrophica bacterium]|nr:ATP-dependent zinc metalloprotease FtsH [Candidatus Omnitrophota bacterium]
ISPETHTRVTFDDVAGIDEAKEELREIIEFLKDPKRFQRLGGKIPKGVLLIGLPGTGKTLLAKAVAGEANVPFYSISGSDFVEMFVGVGASRVRDLFEQARKNARQGGRGAIVFIDEIDAVGRQRFAGIGGGHDEREQTLNALLVEMDGFDTQEGIILMAATNRPDVLDPALLRPGRFDRQVVISLPDILGREAILKVHTRKIKLGKEVDLKSVARQTPGFSGADLANLANESALLAARLNKDVVGIEELEKALERVIAGPERKTRMLNEKEKTITAFHEAGHALVALLTPGTDPIHKVSIIPRGAHALGYTMQLPTEDRYTMSKSELLARMTVMMGGRTAEELVFREITTGAQNDIETATEMARRMVCEFGMSERLGNLTYGKRERQMFLGRDLFEERNYSEQTAILIDEEIRRLIDTCHGHARKVLAEHRAQLDSLANTLLEKEVLDGEEVKRFLGPLEPLPVPSPTESSSNNRASSA